MIDLHAQFVQMLEMESPYGTIYRRNNVVDLWWSPIERTGASRDFDTNDGTWMWLGTEGWWANDKHKADFYKLEKLVHGFPNWPGDFDTL